MIENVPETVADRPRSAFLAAVTSLVVSLPVLYVLSVGPVARLCQTVSPNFTPNWVHVFYSPLIWLHANTPLRAPLEWYVELWGAH
jgi:hypothetical protein